MKSLFDPDINEISLVQILRHHRKGLLPPIGTVQWQRAFSNPLIQPLLSQIKSKVESEMGTPIASFTKEYFDEIIVNKKISLAEYDTLSTDRYRRLAESGLILLSLSPNDPLYRPLKDFFFQGIEGLLAQEIWYSPFHAKHVTLDLLVVRNSQFFTDFIELFEQLISTDLKERILKRLQKELFSPYIADFKTFWWAGPNSNNWNAVCNQGIVGPALGLIENDQTLIQILLHAKESLQHFLSQFGSDGGCSEGPTYWEYGFAHFTLLNEQVEYYTNNELSLFEGNDLIHKIARFGINTSLQNHHLVNFADCAIKHLFFPPYMEYLGNRLKNNSLVQLSQRDYQSILFQPLAWNRNFMELHNLVYLFLHCPTSLPHTIKPRQEDTYYDQLAVLVVRSLDSQQNFIELAAKGGHNGEYHNHNDCGNFLLHVNGEPFLVDLGQPVYTPEYFTDRRYESFGARSRGHSLPVINGCEQAGGREFKSKVVIWENTSERVLFCVDLTRTYPKEAGCESYIRSIQLDKATGVFRLHDHFELSKTESLENALIATLPIQLEDHRAIIQGKSGALGIIPIKGTRLAGVETHLFVPRWCAEIPVYRLRLVPDQINNSVDLTFQTDWNALKKQASGAEQKITCSVETF
jgi:hypothetical protein